MKTLTREESAEYILGSYIKSHMDHQLPSGEDITISYVLGSHLWNQLTDVEQFRFLYYFNKNCHRYGYYPVFKEGMETAIFIKY